jgi:hypothetical protein
MFDKIYLIIAVVVIIIILVVVMVPHNSTVETLVSKPNSKYISTTPEVYQYGTAEYPYTRGYKFEEAKKRCPTGSVLATQAQLIEAWGAGADWCTSGFNNDATSGYPVNESSKLASCGGPPAVRMFKRMPDVPANINCYGIKPREGTFNIRPWNQTKWSRTSPSSYKPTYY